MPKHENNYYTLYLKRELRDENDPRADDEDYLQAKAYVAAAEFETRRLEGMTVDQAQECAMQVLLEDLNNN